MENRYYPVVVQAVPSDNYEVYAYFSDGKIKLFDMKPLIQKGGVFKQLKDIVFFNKNLTVMNDTIAWDLSGCHDPYNCIDVDPFEVYEAENVEDPLK